MTIKMYVIADIVIHDDGRVVSKVGVESDDENDLRVKQIMKNIALALDTDDVIVKRGLKKPMFFSLLTVMVGALILVMRFLK